MIRAPQELIRLYKENKVEMWKDLITEGNEAVKELEK